MNTYFSKIADGLADHGYAIIEGFLDDAFITSMRREGEEMLEKGQFRHAGVGKGASFVVRPEIRGDQVKWLDKDKLSPHFQEYWDFVESLRQYLNQDLFLNLKDFECMFAIYPPDSFYKRHLDQFKEVQYRQLTCILYLNEHWKPEDGGLLRMYLPDEHGLEQVKDIFPQAGTFVCFRSASIYHEVLPTARERYSITGWLKN